MINIILVTVMSFKNICGGVEKMFDYNDLSREEKERFCNRFNVRSNEDLERAIDNYR